METLIRTREKGAVIEKIFDSSKECNIRHYAAENAQNYDPEQFYTFEVNIRHSEDQDPKELLEKAIEKCYDGKKEKNGAFNLRGHLTVCDHSGQDITNI